MQLAFDFLEMEQAAPAVKKAGAVVYRPYQVKAIDSVFEQWESHSSTLVVSATGTGKSVIFSGTMERFSRPGRYLVLAHRDELVRQAAGHAKRAGLSAGIEMASMRSSSEDVIVSTIQTQCSYSNCTGCFNRPYLSQNCMKCSGSGKIRRFSRFNPFDFGLLIIDEAHHATAESYRTVLQWYGQNPDLKILLVTATPKRSDKIGLHNVCQSVAFEYDVIDAISDGWLVPIRQRFVEVAGLDLSKVATQSGDLQAGGVERAFINATMDEEYMLHQVAKPTIDEAKGRPTILFAPGQDYAKKITAAFNAYPGVTAECIIDSVSKEHRQEIIARYKNGQTQILVNCMVFTEGFDAPETAVVANCRPTKSDSLYRQMIGRGTRPLPGLVDGIATAERRAEAIANSRKPYCTVLDFVGNAGRHKLVSVVDVLAGDGVDKVDLEAALKYARKRNEALDMNEVIEKQRQKRLEREAKRKANKRKVEQTSHFAHEVDYRTTDVDPFAGDAATAVSTKPSKTGTLTDKQFSFLTQRVGLSYEEAAVLSKENASKKIGQWIKRKQLKGK